MGLGGPYVHLRGMNVRQYAIGSRSVGGHQNLPTGPVVGNCPETASPVTERDSTCPACRAIFSQHESNLSVTAEDSCRSGARGPMD
jgi:hypothetical protein